VGQLLVALRARSARNRRKGAAQGTAHDKLQVAVAYLCHGEFLLHSVYLGLDARFRSELTLTVSPWNLHLYIRTDIISN
jgi:hypothetical protein